jgi:hypothetical protein
VLRDIQILETPFNGGVNRGEKEALATSAVAELDDPVSDCPVLFV